jgi:excinuclease ABC subunit C
MPKQIFGRNPNTFEPLKTVRQIALTSSTPFHTLNSAMRILRRSSLGIISPLFVFYFSEFATSKLYQNCNNLTRIILLFTQVVKMCFYRYSADMDENGLKTQISALPQSPGIYIYKDASGKLLYIGKAKNLRSRVRSYFGKSTDLGPTKEKMVSLIATLETIATDTELEALVLEANLIRKNQPPYNVLLRDDKYYLFIKITKDNPVRIFPVRKILKDNAQYFGPYSSARSVRETLKLLRRIFPFREEKDRPRDIIFPHTLFPTTITPASDSAEHVTKFLRGNRQDIITTLEHGINEAAKNLQYEQAVLFRDQLRAIERLEGSQKVYLPRKESFDVISISESSTQSAGNVLQIREGKLIGKQTFLLRHRIKTNKEDILRQFIMQYYSVAKDTPHTIYIPFSLSDIDGISEWIAKITNTPITLQVPERGVKKQLLSMGQLNASNLLREESAVTQTAVASKTAMDELLKYIGIIPQLASLTPDNKFRIETYDISNIQGELATASMIVFENGVPAKNEYRKFKIRLNQDASPSQHKSNDFAMLTETLTRRLARSASNDWPLPDLIIIDGGKGQLSSAQKALQQSGFDIPMISIAKQEEEIFLPNNPTSIRIPYDSPALFLIQRMRDEAHRFVITYHRKLRSREQIKSILDEVPGIGPKTKKALLKEFGSVKNIKDSEDTEIEKIIGIQKTKVLREWL